jgi:hypothetical protein
MPNHTPAICIAVLWALLAAGAPLTAVAQQPASGSGTAVDQIVIQGEVTYVAIEGGFWGIIGSDGKRYDPGRLAREFQQPGLKVRVDARPLSGQLSFRMWGTPIEILHIEKH